MAAIAAYRHLLRSARIAFEGDLNVLSAARLQVRQNFEANRSLSPSSEEYTKQVAHAEEVASFLKANVVQAVASDEGKYKLRIHEHTERGNNEDIKTAGKGTKNTLAGVKCCSA